MRCWLAVAAAALLLLAAVPAASAAPQDITKAEARQVIDGWIQRFIRTGNYDDWRVYSCNRVNANRIVCRWWVHLVTGSRCGGNVAAWKQGTRLRAKALSVSC